MTHQIQKFLPPPFKLKKANGSYTLLIILSLSSLSLSLSASRPYLHDGRYNGHDDGDRNVELTAMVGQRLSMVSCGTFLPLHPFQPFEENQG
jgi:hypothetical protein